MFALGCEQTAKVLDRPLPEIVGASARESFGLDYQVHVDCTVLNKGASGDITVTAILQKGGYWKKQEALFVREDESRKVAITFSEPTLLQGGLSSGDFSCNASG